MERARWTSQWRRFARRLACAALVPALFAVSPAALAQAKRSTAQQPAAATEKRIAVVIGNARYPAIPLNNPENDARVVAATLRKLGFEVSEHVNLPVKKFRQVLRDYVRRLQNESGIGVLYYAGHGVQIDGRNYLLPVDINLRDEEEIKDEAVDIDDLFMSKLARAKTRGLIVILDACRDNPFRAKTRNIRATGGLAEMGVAGTLIGYCGRARRDRGGRTGRHQQRVHAPSRQGDDLAGHRGRADVQERAPQGARRNAPAPDAVVEHLADDRLPLQSARRRRAHRRSQAGRPRAPAGDARPARVRAGRLEEELEAARRELRRQQPGERTSPADPAPSTASAPANGNAGVGAAAAPAAAPRTTPSEIRHFERQFDPPRVEPAPPRTEPESPARVESAPPARPDLSAAGATRRAKRPQRRLPPMRRSTSPKSATSAVARPRRAGAAARRHAARTSARQGEGRRRAANPNVA